MKDIGFVRSEQDEGRQKFRIFVSRCEIQGECDEENKKQLQGADECCRGPVPEDDSGVLIAHIEKQQKKAIDDGMASIKRLKELVRD